MTHNYLPRTNSVDKQQPPAQVSNYDQIIAKHTRPQHHQSTTNNNTNCELQHTVIQMGIHSGGCTNSKGSLHTVPTKYLKRSLSKQSLHSAGSKSHHAIFLSRSSSKATIQNQHATSTPTNRTKTETGVKTVGVQTEVINKSTSPKRTGKSITKRTFKMERANQGLGLKKQRITA